MVKHDHFVQKTMQGSLGWGGGGGGGGGGGEGGERGALSWGIGWVFASLAKTPVNAYYWDSISTHTPGTHIQIIVIKNKSLT